MAPHANRSRSDHERVVRGGVGCVHRALFALAVLLLQSPSTPAERVTLLSASNGVAFAPELLNFTVYRVPLSRQFASLVLKRFDGEHESISFAGWSLLTTEQLGDALYVQCGAEEYDLYRDGLSDERPLFDSSVLSRPGVLLPTMHPHNSSALAKYIAAELSSQRIPQPPLDLFVTLVSVPLPEPTCSLTIRIPSRQRRWPLVRISGSTLASDAREREIALSGSIALELTPMTAVSVTADVSEDAPNAQRIPHSLYLDIALSPRPRSSAEWCSVSSQSRSAHPGRSASSGGVISLLQVQGFLKMIGAGLKMVTTPLLDSVMGVISRHLEHEMVSHVGDACLENTPPQVIELSETPMKVNISNMVTDGAITRVTDNLVRSMGNAMGPPIEDKVSTMLAPALHQKLEPILTRVISDDVIRVIPDIIARGIKVQLPPRLIKSLTHALVPTITETVNYINDPQGPQWCQLCHYENKFCAKCRVSTSNTYFTIYYSAYYSDYYADYYKQYYTEALMVMDRFTNPDQWKK